VQEHAFAIPRARPRERALWTASPWTVAGVVAVAYLAFVIPFAVGGVNDFAQIGHRFLTQSTTSTVITPSLDYQSEIGFDGQFYLFLALDPRHAQDYMDMPAYRYSRIGYPILARGMSGGNSVAIPYMMILINVAAVVGGTLAAAIWLRRRRTSPWFALLYGFFPAMIFSVLRDLGEPLAFGLAAWAMVVFDPRSWRRLLASAGILAYALLTRETVALIPAIMFLSLLFGGASVSGWASRVRQNVARAAVFAAVAFAPMFAWRYAVSLWISGASGISGDSHEGATRDIVPLHGIIGLWPWTKEELLVLVAVVVPGVLALLLALGALLTKRSAELALLVLSVAVFILFIPTWMEIDYGSAGRAAIGVMLPLVLAVPLLREVFGDQSRVLGWSLALWSLPCYFLAVIVLSGPGPALFPQRCDKSCKSLHAKRAPDAVGGSARP
jgi:hypothetical protein